MRIFNSLSLSLESLTPQGGNLFLTDLQSYERTTSSDLTWGLQDIWLRSYGYGWLILQVQTKDETTAPDPPTLSSLFLCILSSTTL